MEEKKNNSKNILIAVLLVLVLALGGFIVYDKVIDKQEFTNNNSEKENINNDNNNKKIIDTVDLKLNGVWRQINGNECFKMDNDEFSFGIWGTDAVIFCKYNKLEKKDNKKYILYGTECHVAGGENKTDKTYELSYNESKKSFEVLSIDGKKQTDFSPFYYAGKDFDEADDFTIDISGFWYADNNEYYEIANGNLRGGVYKTGFAMNCKFEGVLKLQNGNYKILANNCEMTNSHETFNKSNVEFEFVYNGPYTSSITIIDNSNNQTYYYIGKIQNELEEFEKIWDENYDASDKNSIKKIINIYKQS